MIACHNNTIIHIVDGPKPALRYEEIHNAIQPGDTFMMEFEILDKEKAIRVSTVCQAVVEKKYRNWFELKVIEEREEVVHSKKKRAVITKRVIHNCSATLGKILSDSAIGGIFSSADLSKALEKRTLKDLFEDKKLGKRVIEDVKLKRRISLI
mgnify:CR=1 FL=1